MYCVNLSAMTIRTLHDLSVICEIMTSNVYFCYRISSFQLPGLMLFLSCSRNIVNSEHETAQDHAVRS